MKALIAVDRRSGASLKCMKDRMNEADVKHYEFYYQQ